MICSAVMIIIKSCGDPKWIETTPNSYFLKQLKIYTIISPLKTNKETIKPPCVVCMYTSDHNSTAETPTWTSKSESISVSVSLLHPPSSLPCNGDPEGLLDRPGMGLQRPPMPPPPKMQPLPARLPAPAPPPKAAALFSSCSISSNPALFWKRDIRFTTRGDMWVRAHGAPP